MELYREITEQLSDWKQKRIKQHLLLTGAPGVGKTTSITKFSNENFAGKMFFDLKNNMQDRAYFEKELKAEELKKKVAETVGNYNKEDILLVFDGMDEETYGKNAITVIVRFLTETLKDYHICIVTSLKQRKVLEKRFEMQYQILEMFAITLQEFFISNHAEDLMEAMENQALEALSEDVQKKLLRYMQVYFTTGGMPYVLNTYMESRDLQQVYQARAKVYQDYMSCIEKISDEKLRKKVKEIFESIPKQLERKGKIFKYGRIKPFCGSLYYGKAMQWLVDRNMVIPVTEIINAKMPLYTQENVRSRIIYYQDIGILAHTLEVKFEDLIGLDTPYDIKEHAMVENYILHHLKVKKEYQKIYFWRSEAGERMEFVCEGNGEVVPIKYNTDGKEGHVIREFRREAGAVLAISITKDTLEFTEKEIQVPIYSIWNL